MTKHLQCPRESCQTRQKSECSLANTSIHWFEGFVCHRSNYIYTLLERTKTAPCLLEKSPSVQSSKANF